jgi:phage putative head morphogenesis protein, SPP1 gp7 family
MVKRFVSAARRSTRQRAMKPVRPSRQIEAWYRAELLMLVKAYRAAVQAEVLPLLEKAVSSQLTEDASIIDRIDSLLKRLGMGFNKSLVKRADKLAAALIKKTDAQVLSRLTVTAAASFGLNLAGFLRRSPKLETAIEAATVNNIGLIRSIPDQYLERVKAGVYSAVTQGTRFETVKEDIIRFGVVSENRAKLIARDQTAKLNSSISRIRQTDLGITQYRWSTSGDERVRQTHRDNDGKIFDWSDPPAETGHPGDDYQCRCVAVPIIDLGED